MSEPLPDSLPPTPRGPDEAIPSGGDANAANDAATAPSADTVKEWQAPSVADLQNQLCPNCSTGVLYVTTYDPEALFEAGQDLSAQNQHASGGAYSARCLNCNFNESVPFRVLKARTEAAG